MSEENGVKPEFNFDNFSLRRGKAWGEIAARATELEAQMLELGDPPNVAEDKAGYLAHSRTVTGLLRELNQQAAEQRYIMSRVLVSVPRAWLDDEAPEELDWSQPESLEYVQEQRYAELIQAFTEGRRGVPKF